MKYKRIFPIKKQGTLRNGVIISGAISQKTPPEVKNAIFSPFCTEIHQHLHTESDHLLLKFESITNQISKEVCDMADKQSYYIPIDGTLVEVEEHFQSES